MCLIVQNIRMFWKNFCKRRKHDTMPLTAGGPSQRCVQFLMNPRKRLHFHKTSIIGGPWYLCRCNDYDYQTGFKTKYVWIYGRKHFVFKIRNVTKRKLEKYSTSLSKKSTQTNIFEYLETFIQICTPFPSNTFTFP